ncbi:MAG: tetratricopeptide repeat protein [Verrucomicrobiota bacterium]
MKRCLPILAGVLVLAFGAQAEDSKSLSLRDRAVAAWKARNYTNAVALASEAISGDKKDPRLWNFRAQMRAILGDYSGAISDFTEALGLAPDSATLYQERAMARFKLGQIPEAVTDFDRANELDPGSAPQNWQRGLALYFTRRYAEGKQQFELHKTVNPHDVENAVWHFACVARAENLEAAKKQIIDVTGDSRVPMAEIQELFAGTGDPKDVLEAAREAPGDAAEKRSAEFYANLYLGLYYDLHGKSDDAIQSVKAAVSLSPPGDYMGHVARIYLQFLTRPAPADSAQSPATPGPASPASSAAKP